MSAQGGKPPLGWRALGLQGGESSQPRKRTPCKLGLLAAQDEEEDLFKDLVVDDLEGEGSAPLPSLPLPPPARVGRSRGGSAASTAAMPAAASARSAAAATLTSAEASTSAAAATGAVNDAGKDCFDFVAKSAAELAQDNPSMEPSPAASVEDAPAAAGAPNSEAGSPGSTLIVAASPAPAPDPAEGARAGAAAAAPAAQGLQSAATELASAGSPTGHSVTEPEVGVVECSERSTPPESGHAAAGSAAGAALTQSLTRRRTMRGPGLLSLPPDVLERLGSQLELADRVRLQACCKTVLREMAGLRSLWTSVSARLASRSQLLSLAGWLGDRRGLVSRLEVDVAGLQKSYELDFGELVAMLHMLTGELAGTPLRALSIQGYDQYGTLSVSSWLLGLRQLEELQIKDVNSMLPSAALLTALTSLQLNFSSHNSTTALNFDKLPPRLQRLTASGGGHALAPQGLERLTALSQLRLSKFSGPLPPPQLSALTGLVELRVSRCTPAPDDLPQGADLEPLLSLHSVTALELSHCGTLEVPAGLLALPALQELSLAGNNIPAGIPAGPGTASALEALSMDLVPAARSAATLAAATHITALRLHGSRGENLFSSMQPQELRALLLALRALPHLRLLAGATALAKACSTHHLGSELFSTVAQLGRHTGMEFAEGD